MPACYCRCHVGSMIHYAPDVRDPIAAVTACPACLNAHTPALVSEWPIVPAPNPLLLPPCPDPQADGEGRES